jgi:hypothetical protein
LRGDILDVKVLEDGGDTSAYFPSALFGDSIAPEVINEGFDVPSNIVDALVPLHHYWQGRMPIRIPNEVEFNKVPTEWVVFVFYVACGELFSLIVETNSVIRGG